MWGCGALASIFVKLFKAPSAEAGGRDGMFLHIAKGREITGFRTKFQDQKFLP